ALKEIDVNETMQERVLRGLVKVRVPGATDGGHATGFLVQGEILTAAHCLPALPAVVNEAGTFGGTQVEIAAYDEATDPDTVWATALVPFADSVSDLAIISESDALGHLNDLPISRCGNREEVAVHVYTGGKRWAQGVVTPGDPQTVSALIRFLGPLP